MSLADISLDASAVLVWLPRETAPIPAVFEGEWSLRAAVFLPFWYLHDAVVEAVEFIHPDGMVAYIKCGRHVLDSAMIGQLYAAAKRVTDTDWPLEQDPLATRL